MTRPVDLKPGDLIPPDRPPARDLGRARIATLVAFFASGAVYAGWVPQIPLVKIRLGLGDQALGAALFGLAAGGIAALPLTAWLITRFGSRRVMLAGGLAFCVLLPLLPVAPSWTALTLLLFLFGAGHGMMDVAMNAQAVDLEVRRGRPLMSSFHAFFSLGNFAAAGGCGLLFAAGLPAALTALAIAAVMLAGLIATAGWLLPGTAERVAAAPALVRPSGLLLTLAALAFAGLLAEEAMTDWSTVFLRFARGTSEAAAAGGYAAYAAAMAVGRLIGDRLVQALGPARLIRAGSLFAAAGLALAIASPWAGAAVIGFAAVGFGIANTMPLLFGAAGRAPRVKPGHGIAVVATAAYGAFLVGPLMIGFTAERLSLPTALGLVVLALLCVAGGSAVLRRPS
jgi:predicted MFS family arabinose efflux permease